MKIGIIGGGISGLAAAYKLGKLGHRVTVFEASPFLGGLGAYLSIGVGYVERFYHHFFVSDSALIQLINELRLSQKLRFYPAKTGIFHNGSIYPFSSALDVLRFKPLSPFDRLRLGATTALTKYFPYLPSSLDKLTATHWIDKYAGKRAYKVVWAPLLEGKFANYACSIPALWLWGRVRDRSFKLGYLDGSIKVLFETVAAAIKQEGGTIKLNSPVKRIQSRKKEVKIVASHGSFLFDKVIIAASSNVAAYLLADELPTQFRKLLMSVDHLGAVSLILTLRRPVQSQYWLNICELDSAVLVMIEHTNLIDNSHYGGKHIVYLANYFHQSDPRFQKSEKAIIKEYSAFLSRLNSRFDGSWIEGAFLSKTPLAQTIFPLGSLNRLPPIKLPIPHIYMINIDQMYPHDRNLNQGIILAQKVTNLIVSES